MRRFVFVAALLALGCAARDRSCEKSALGIEGGAKQGEGVLIAEVLPRGPADLAGIRRGDLLLSIGGRKVRYACEVPALVFQRDCSPVSVIVSRDGARIEKTITPAEQESLYRSACEAQDPTACFRLAWFADATYEDACDRGSGEACAAYGYVLMEARDAEAVDVLERACDRGSGAGCTHLGYLYVTGSIVPKNDIRALDFYTRGCSYGDARGCYNVGTLHDRGKGTSVSATRAMAAYEQACAAGMSMACTDAGVLYERGLGTMKDAARAAEMYRRGCEGSPCEPSNVVGCMNLGRAYRDGIGLTKDPARAAEIFRTVCEQKVEADDEETKVRACVLLGAFQISGLGVAKDVKAGLARSEDGCTRGDALGCFNVAANHAWSEDFTSAAKYYAKACEGEDAESCYELGVLYDEAKGVPYDPVRSAALIRRACDGGFAKACSERRSPG
ncbi:MAG TPA: PDZ domain-containing protein [Thermoanaerobaculia bacterium]|nr:PDZ domain-containing protein [Thermoanaerobaculia bacterium]